MKNIKQDIIFYVVAIIILLIMGEIFFRIYIYNNPDFIVGANQREIDMKRKYMWLTNESNLNLNQSAGDAFIHDPILGLRPKPNFHHNIENFGPYNETHNALIKMYITNINSQGIRKMEEVTKEKDPNLVRIALIGSSFTFGEEAEDRVTFPGLLQVMTEYTEILNFGMSSAGISYFYLIFKKEVLEYNPDIVIVNIYLNDIGKDSSDSFKPLIEIGDSGNLSLKNIPFPSNEEFLRDYKQPLIESYFIKFLLFRINKLTRDEADSYEYGFELLDVVLDRMKSDLKDKKLFVTIITPRGYNPNSELNDYDKLITHPSYLRLKEMLSKKQITYLDSSQVFGKEFDKYGDDTTIFYNPQHHFTLLGNTIFAQNIKIMLEKEDLIKKTISYPYFYDRDKDRAVFFINKDKKTERVIYPYNITKNVEK